MHLIRLPSPVVIGTIAALALTACGGNVTVTGRVTDTDGTQQQGLSSGPAFGGTGTVSSASEVTANSVGPNGALTLIAEAEVQANGSYQLEVPEGSERVVLQAITTSGEVVASALLDAAVRAEGESNRIAAPMSSETSLEAEVYMQMIADGTSAESVDTVDLRSRITAQLALAVRSQATSEEQLKSLQALASGVRAAQEAELQAYAKAGVTTTQESLFEASLRASAALDAALESGSRSADEVYADFFASIRSGQQQIDEKTEAEGEREAGVAFRASVEAKLTLAAEQAIVDAAVLAAASLEARAAEAAVDATLRAAGASDAVIARAADAAAALRLSLRNATTAAAAAGAWTAYSTELSSSANLSASVLGAFVEASFSQTATLQGAIQDSSAAGATLDGTLGLVVETIGGLSTTQIAASVADAFAVYHTTVRAQATALAVFGAKAAPAAEILVVAHGSFRAN